MDKNRSNDNPNKNLKSKEKTPTYGLKEGLKRENTELEELDDYAKKTKIISEFASKHTKEIGKDKSEDIPDEHTVKSRDRIMTVKTDSLSIKIAYEESNMSVNVTSGVPHYASGEIYAEGDLIEQISRVNLLDAIRKKARGEQIDNQKIDELKNAYMDSLNSIKDDNKRNFKINRLPKHEPYIREIEQRVSSNEPLSNKHIVFAFDQDWKIASLTYARAYLEVQRSHSNISNQKEVQEEFSISKAALRSIVGKLLVNDTDINKLFSDTDKAIDEAIQKKLKNTPPMTTND